MTNMKSVLFCLGALIASSISYADDSKLATEETAENQTSINWEESYIEPDLLKPHFGEKVRKVCFEDEFDANPDLYKEISLRPTRTRGSRSSGGWQSSGSGVKVQRYRLMEAGRDFIVAGKYVVVVNTPETGTHIVTTKKGCGRTLPDAQQLAFIKNRPKGRFQGCIHSSRAFAHTVRDLLSQDADASILKNKSGTFYGCQIDEIFKWEGELNLAQLVEQSRALRGEKTAEDKRPEDK